MTTTFDGFLRTDGTRIVDGHGRTLVLRGIGLGNWLLPEGYMWKFADHASSPRQIERVIRDLVGDETAREFWSEFRARFISERDIERIAEAGFDHVRLPINSREVIDDDGRFIEAGFDAIDDVIEWSRRNGLWVLLDLHGAPGGQTGTNIDDSPNNKPELFMDERYRRLTLDLWREIATRYRDNTVVAGYDLLNEPLPNEWQDIYPAELVALYKELTAVIREVDENHIIMYEGSHWATNWSIFDERWDDNSVLQFHRYWCAPDESSIQEYLDARDRLGVPIYMGEGGENNPAWVYTAHRLYEDNGIGWNYWPWKKVDTLTSPASIVPPDGWGEIVAFANGDGPAPSSDHARAVLGAFLENAAIDSCVWRSEIIAALFAEAPLDVPVWAWGFRGEGVSWSSTGEPMAGVREADAVAIRYADGEVRAEHDWHRVDGSTTPSSDAFVVELSAGDWLEYTVRGGENVELDASGEVSVELGDSALRVTAVTDAVLRRISVA
ncbi:glycoside hydrolase family 5 protein [Agromyces atrinae]|uniref:Endoglucanase n=1 Tax=Agromyces atrinae TaxID=592376 RepID=A0A4Q2M9G7_9MICO|nr:cellulase family glycosylhydrolase [Agromyces atrinae]NYD66354.1 hypothetical protein [Agromyces atrinae]RXZ86671.1 endoglucanase [Agromyces atrinae]